MEKAVGGVRSSSRTDGGTTSAMFGQLLIWMNESKSQKYIVATCNDIDEMLAISQGALLRAGRIDDIFFVDVPSAEERKEILSIMNKRYGTAYSVDLAEKMENFTGAEIENWIKTALYEGEESAFHNARLAVNKSRKTIEACRTWALSNARMANATDAVWSVSKRKLNMAPQGVREKASETKTARAEVERIARQTERKGKEEQAPVVPFQHDGLMQS